MQQVSGMFYLSFSRRSSIWFREGLPCDPIGRQSRGAWLGGAALLLIVCLLVRCNLKHRLAREAHWL
jgi:hypothetical protein